MSPRPLANEAVVLEQVTLEYISYHIPVGGRFSKWSRLQKQQHATGRVAVRVILSSDQVHQLMAEGHCAECPFLSRRLEFAVREFPSDFPCSLEVVSRDATVNEQCPVHVAARCDFPSSH